MSRLAPELGRERRVLIYRLGSLGDTVVALPLFHLIRRAFPDAETCVLTNIPVSSKAPPLMAVLGDRFAQQAIAYPLRLRAPGELIALRRKIAAWRPDLMIYLTAPRGRGRTLRDAVYFRLCRVPRIVGLPLAADLAEPRGPDGDGLWESETARLARCLAFLGDPRLSDPASWSLEFAAAERAEADRALAAWPGRSGFVALGIGTKQPPKDWGEANWRAVLQGLKPRHAGLGLAFLGDAADAAAAARVSAGWDGPVANLCGTLSPRVSALVIARARLFVGLDSGPMHLAASVGVPAVAVFGIQSRPGIWFPHGARHRVLYPGLAWSGGDPPVRRDAAGETGLSSIRPDQVIEACEPLLTRRG